MVTFCTFVKVVHYSHSFKNEVGNFTNFTCRSFRRWYVLNAISSLDFCLSLVIPKIEASAVSFTKLHWIVSSHI